MLKLAPATEQFQHFVSNLRESFWGDLNGRTREAWKKFFEADSERQRDRGRQSVAAPIPGFV